MKKCESYHTRERYIYDPHIPSIKHTVVEGECWGTMERDTCHCNGDRCQCNFYPEVRQKALEEKYNKEKDKDIKHVKESLEFYLHSHAENGVVYIPEFMVKRMIKELK